MRSRKLAFIAVESLWVGYTIFEFALLMMSECFDEACRHYSPYVYGYYFWRGLGVGLLIWIAFRFVVRRYRRMDA